MHHIDEDNITGAVIARHAAAGDARVRELMTSLVQHLHGFARDIKLSEAEWAEGLRFLGECGQLRDEPGQELQLLSDTLGLSTLVTALNQRKPAGCTESTPRGPSHDTAGVACYVRGRVRALDGTGLAGARVQVGPPDTDAVDCGVDGRFELKAIVAEPSVVPHDGPVGRLLQSLGRDPWRPAHLHFNISAPGCRPLVTQVFRRGDPYLGSDAAFGVRRSLVADWLRHEPGRTPDGSSSDVAFYTLDFDFVLDKA
jgi:hydroxyquinol 1,2-dioxygenase